MEWGESRWRVSLFLLESVENPGEERRLLLRLRLGSRGVVGLGRSDEALNRCLELLIMPSVVWEACETGLGGS